MGRLAIRVGIAAPFVFVQEAVRIRILKWHRRIEQREIVVQEPGIWDLLVREAVRIESVLRRLGQLTRLVLVIQFRRKQQSAVQESLALFARRPKSGLL